MGYLFKIVHRRKQGTPLEEHPGIKESVYTVHPNNFECYLLRLLLHTVRGPTSFQELRTVNGQICETYRQACQLSDLLDDDTHWNTTLEEAATNHSPAKLRDLFAIMISTCGLSDPAQLWENPKESLAEDVYLQLKRDNPSVSIEYTPAIYNKALIIIEDKVMLLVGKELQQFGLPVPIRTQDTILNNQIYREMNYNIDDLKQYTTENEPKLVSDQATAYNKIIHRVDSNTGGIMFLDSPGGTAYHCT